MTKVALAGNRTRAARVAGEHSTTEPPMRMSKRRKKSPINDHVGLVGAVGFYSTFFTFITLKGTRPYWEFSMARAVAFGVNPKVVCHFGLNLRAADHRYVKVLRLHKHESGRGRHSMHYYRSVAPPVKTINGP